MADRPGRRQARAREARAPYRRCTPAPRASRALRELLASLPSAPTRLSVARDLGDDYETGSGTTRHLLEFGGFIVYGAATIEQIVECYGYGPYRITAYGLEPRGLRWEVLAPVDRPAPPKSNR